MNVTHTFFVLRQRRVTYWPKLMSHLVLSIWIRFFFFFLFPRAEKCESHSVCAGLECQCFPWALRPILDMIIVAFTIWLIGRSLLLTNWMHCLSFVWIDVVIRFVFLSQSESLFGCIMCVTSVRWNLTYMTDLYSLSLLFLEVPPCGTDPDKDGLRYSVQCSNSTFCFTYLPLIICFMHFDWVFFVVSTFPFGQGPWFISSSSLWPPMLWSF